MTPTDAPEKIDTTPDLARHGIVFVDRLGYDFDHPQTQADIIRVSNDLADDTAFLYGKVIRDE